MKSGGPLEWYLGIKFEHGPDGSISINQNNCITKKLDEFKSYIGPPNLKRSSPFPANVPKLLEEAEESTELIADFPYHQMACSLLFASVGTRIDLSYPISVLCKYLAKPKKIHCELLIHVYQYVRGNSDYSINYQDEGNTNLTGYVDAAYANSVDCKSTSGYLFLLNGGLVSWSAKKQSVWARSSAEAEYISTDGASKDMLWLKEWLEDVDLPQGCVPLYEDNEACIALTKNPQYHNKTKHIGILYHAVRDLVTRREC
jgi:hypothetical protein